jgi:hypothetical protein
MHRGTTPTPPHLGGVPDGPQEQIGRQLRLVVKSYVASHVRTLPNGRQVTVEAYFTKRVPKPADPAKPRPRAVVKKPISSAYASLAPEKLAQRLVRHVHEGTMTPAEAHANLDHLERYAHAGHTLAHGHGHDWTPGETHSFIEHARGGLKLHAERMENQRIRQQEEDDIKRNREKNDREDRLKQEREERQKRRLVIKQKHQERQEQLTKQPSALSPRSSPRGRD